MSVRKEIPFITLSVLVIFFLISCSGSLDNFEIKSSNGKPIINGILKNGKPDGTWKYFDEKNNLIMERFYRNNILEKTIYYSDGNVIYIESFHDNLVENRVAFGVDGSYSGGLYILESKCNACHSVAENGIAPSIDKLVIEKKLMDNNLFTTAFMKKSNQLDSMHSKIPLDKFEIDDIIRYLKYNDK